MIERDLGDGGRWYLECRSYPTSLMAKRAWERVEATLNMAMGDEGIGVIRLAPNPAGGAQTGTQEPSVVVVTLDLATARKASRLLRDGAEWIPEPEFADAMIARRAQVMVAHHGQTGRLLIRRPENRGASLDRSGHLHEPGGQG